MEPREVVFNGETYVRNPKSRYYFKRTTRNSERRGAKQLHRAVWEFYNGPVPDGCHIHHIDGDIDNNDISNLECISPTEHLSMHGKRNMEDPEFRRKALETLDAAREKAAEWHHSEEGREWHVRHTEESLAKAWEKVERTCEVCGKKYMATKRSHYCSPRCECEARRRRNGVIRKVEIRRCARCGSEFTSNTANQKYCSAKCANAAKYERKRRRISGE